MEFSNLHFIFILMPLIFAVYYLVPKMEQKNTVLLVASLVMYAFGQLYYLPLLLLTAYLNYRMSDYVTPGKRSSLVLPLALNIGVLVLLKYLNFLLGIFGVTGADGGAAVSLVAPIGISFYTFQLIAYHVDIYREKADPAENFKKFLLEDTATRPFASLTFSAPELETNVTYTVTVNGIVQQHGAALVSEGTDLLLPTEGRGPGEFEIPEPPGGMDQPIISVEGSRNDAQPAQADGALPVRPDGETMGSRDFTLTETCHSFWNVCDAE